MKALPSLRRKRVPDQPEIPIAPMIDCVFLMLVYFMTTSSLERSEADLPCPLGGQGRPSAAMPAVDEQRIHLDATGKANWNGTMSDLRSDRAAREALATRLQSFAQACQAAGREPRLHIQPDPLAPHESLIHLLDAVSLSGITALEIR